MHLHTASMFLRCGVGMETVTREAIGEVVVLHGEHDPFVPPTKLAGEY